MSATTIENLGAISARVLAEGYGSDAWHGPDLRAALAGVTEDLAFWRPGGQRHSIAEIALHHAYHTRNVFAKITGSDPGAFPVVGEDWFDLPDGSRLSWKTIQDIVEREQNRLVAADRDIATRKVSSPLSLRERFDLVLGITCHAVYHAGQIQLIKKLRDH